MTAVVTSIPQPHHRARRDVAASVRAHLGARNINDSELARMIGVTQSAMSRRTNERVPFDVDELGLIADALGISVVDLIQMPTSSPVGGGNGRLYGVGTSIHRTITANRPSMDYKPADSRSLVQLAERRELREVAKVGA